MIKKMILILTIMVMIDYIIKHNSSVEKQSNKKYEYKGKYKDEKKERIVEYIGEKNQ